VVVAQLVETSAAVGGDDLQLDRDDPGVAAEHLLEPSDRSRRALLGGEGDDDR
jgi:hypothetical protein